MRILLDVQRLHFANLSVAAFYAIFVLRFQIAEKLGLLHVSEGEGKERHIIVRKPAPDESCAAETDDDPTEDSTETCKESSSGASMKTCDQCNQFVPSENFVLHRIRCQSANRKDSKEKMDVKPKTAKSSKNKRKGKVAVDKKEEDFDALIAAAVKENTTCNFTKCKTLTATLGHNCEFCGKRFCLAQHMPEVHGCGADAKARARRMISRDGVLYSGSGVPSKKPNPDQRARIQRKLDSKLEEMSVKRKSRQKDSAK